MSGPASASGPTQHRSRRLKQIVECQQQKQEKFILTEQYFITNGY
jgi:hypothetical protein